jgi:hypothetical protein
MSIEILAVTRSISKIVDTVEGTVPVPEAERQSIVFRLCRLEAAIPNSNLFMHLVGAGLC